MNKNNHPQINKAIEKYHYYAEKQDKDFRILQVHAMVELFEIIIKTHSAYILARYMDKLGFSDDIKQEFVKQFRRVSLGNWHSLSRMVLKEKGIASYLTQIEYEQVVESIKGDLDKKKNILSEMIVKKKDAAAIEGLKKAISELEGELSLLKCKCTLKAGKYEVDHTGVSDGLAARLMRAVFNNDYFSDYMKKVSGGVEGGNSSKAKKESIDIIKLRNYYAHGAIPFPEYCEADIGRYERTMEWFLKEAQWLNDTTLVVFNQQQKPLVVEGNASEMDDDRVRQLYEINPDIMPERPYLVHRNNEVVSLFPLLEYDKGSNSINFFNGFDIKEEIIDCLHYPTGCHYSKKDLYGEFIKIYDVLSWGTQLDKTIKKEYGDFSQNAHKIMELADKVVGRDAEQRDILEIIERPDIYYCIVTAYAGYGKSSLLSKLYMDLKSNSLYHDKYNVLMYMLRRDLDSGSSSSMLAYLLTGLARIMGKEVSITNDNAMDYSTLKDLLYSYSDFYDKPLVIMLDGIDEGLEDKIPGNNIMEFLPKANFDKVKIIYSYRRSSSIDEELLGRINVENRERYELPRLDDDGIRAMLYRVMDKYKVITELKERMPLIQKRSEGTPLYMALLCKDIKAKKIKLENIDKIPEGILEYYSGVMPKSDLARRLLYVMAAAKEPLRVEHLQNILKVENEIDLENNLCEVYGLIEVSKDGHYSLFHDSFRDYLIMRSSVNFAKAHKAISDFCSLWNDKNILIYGPGYREYMMKYYAYHLREAHNLEDLTALAENVDYHREQRRITGQYRHTIKLYENLLMMDEFEPEVDRIEVGIKALKQHMAQKNAPEYILKMVHKGDIVNALEELRLAREKNRSCLYLLLAFEVSTSDKLSDADKINATKLIFNEYQGYVKAFEGQLYDIVKLFDSFSYMDKTIDIFGILLEKCDKGTKNLRIAAVRFFCEDKVERCNRILESLDCYARCEAIADIAATAYRRSEVESALNAALEVMETYSHYLEDDYYRDEVYLKLSVDIFHAGNKKDAYSVMDMAYNDIIRVSALWKMYNITKDEAEKQFLINEIAKKVNEAYHQDDLKLAEIEEADVFCYLPIQFLERNIKADNFFRLIKSHDEYGQVLEYYETGDKAFRERWRLSYEYRAGELLKEIVEKHRKYKGEIDIRQVITTLENTLVYDRFDYCECPAISHWVSLTGNLNELKDMQEKVKGIIASEVLRSITFKLFEFGEYDEAAELAKSIINRGVRSSTIIKLTEMLIGIWHREKIEMLLKEYLEHAKKELEYEVPTAKYEELTDCVVMMYRIGLCEFAERAARDLADKTECDEKYRSKALSRIAVEAVRMQNKSLKEIDILLKEVDDSYKSNAYTEISIELIKLNQENEALKSLIMINQYNNAARAIARIESERQKQGKTDKLNYPKQLDYIFSEFGKSFIKDEELKYSSELHIEKEAIDYGYGNREAAGIIDYTSKSNFTELFSISFADYTDKENYCFELTKHLHIFYKEIPKVVSKILPYILNNQKALANALANYMLYLKYLSEKDENTMNTYLKELDELIQIKKY